MMQLAAAGSAGLTALAGVTTIHKVQSAEVSVGELSKADGFCIHPPQGTAMQGFPPAEADVYLPEKAAMRRDMHRWALRSTRELRPTQRISRGTGPVRTLKRNPISVDEFNKFVLKNLEGKSLSIAQLVEQQRVDALIVLRKGQIITEQYFGGMTPEQPHDLYSAGKSLTSTMVGTLLGHGLDAARVIEHYLPELKANSGLEGATLRQLLDMTSAATIAIRLPPIRS